MANPARNRNARHRSKSARKPKFQADLAPIEDGAVRSLKEQLQLTSNSDFLSEAVALFQWAVSALRQESMILSESARRDMRYLVLQLLHRAPPQSTLPHVK